MAYPQTLSPSAPYRDVHTAQMSASSAHVSPVMPAVQHPRHPSKQRFVAELSQCLFDFVIQLLPTQDEMAVKEDVRKLLERLIRTIEPDSRLLSFGSTANGFSLRNSDMDLCCLIDSDDKLSAADLVTMLGDLLERETKFHVKPLPHARIPIVKLTLDPSPGLPHGIACDIGFENRLALENTRLLMCYAMIDPTRVRTMVLFLKVWSKRRKINSPYKGTLSSYGYVLLVIYFLVHVKNPPVLPNLQQMPPLRPITTEETHLNGHNIWFFDDIDLLRQRWRSENTESVAELLIDFFRYYARDFQYNTGVASIRAGLLKKEAKGWQSDQYSSSRYDPSRERNRLCIEDPFELDYNVARCVTKDGLYTIRGELMRASRVLQARPERAIVALAELCEERKEEDLVQAPTTFYHSRSTPIPPQTPYTVGSNMRPKNAAPERLSPPTQFFEPSSSGVETKSPRPQLPQQQPPPPPEHMAPKRSKWTSPPPLDAPSVDHTLFQSQFDKSLELATSSTEARQAYGSESNSDVFTDEDRSDAAESDDISSVRSYTEGSPIVNTGLVRRPSWHIPLATRIAQFHENGQPVPLASTSRSPLTSRGRIPRVDRVDQSSMAMRNLPEFVPAGRDFVPRRQSTGPVSLRSFKNGNHSWSPSSTPVNTTAPANASTLPMAPESPLEQQQQCHQARFNESPPPTATTTTVFYQTQTPSALPSISTATRSPRPNFNVYPVPGPQLQHNSLLSQYQSQVHHPHITASPALQSHSPHQVPSPTVPSFIQGQQLPLHHQYSHSQSRGIPPDIFPTNLPPALTSSLSMQRNRTASGRSANGGIHDNSNTPTPGPPYVQSLPVSAATPTPPSQPTPSYTPQPPAQASYTRSPLVLTQTPAHVQIQSGIRGPSQLGVAVSDKSPDSLSAGRSDSGSVSPIPAAANDAGSNSSGSSPTPSSTGYSTSISRSPSPQSPSSLPTSPPQTAVPLHHPHPHSGHALNIGTLNVGLNRKGGMEGVPQGNVKGPGVRDGDGEVEVVDGFTTAFSTLTVREEGEGDRLCGLGSSSPEFLIDMKEARRG